MVALAATTVVTGGLVAPARRADAAAHEAWAVPSLAAVRMPPVAEQRERTRVRFVKDEPDPGAGGTGAGELDEVAVTLRLSGREAAMLRGMLHENVTNDLDLLEDTLYQTELVDQEAVARVALAVRLDVALE